MRKGLKLTHSFHKERSLGLTNSHALSYGRKMDWLKRSSMTVSRGSRHVTEMDDIQVRIMVELGMDSGDEARERKKTKTSGKTTHRAYSTSPAEGQWLSGSVEFDFLLLHMSNNLRSSNSVCILWRRGRKERNQYHGYWHRGTG
jgi:hypothetical protein